MGEAKKPTRNRNANKQPGAEQPNSSTEHQPEPQTRRVMTLHELGAVLTLMKPEFKPEVSYVDIQVTVGEGRNKTHHVVRIPMNDPKSFFRAPPASLTGTLSLNLVPAPPLPNVLVAELMRLLS